MFDTMTGVKIVGGFCGSLLVFLLGVWAAEGLYHVGGGHGEEEQAYVIDTGESEEEGSGEGGPSFEELLASADPAAGERVFAKCKACHQAEQGANATGPYLWNVVGREVGTAEGYTGYSGVLSEHADVWTPENLNHFLENPSGWAPGTAMSFNGLPSVEDRANLIAYLETLSG